MTLLTPHWCLDGILICASLIFAAYIYATRKFKYWAKKGIMEIPPTPFLGNFTDCLLFKKSPAEFLKDLHDRSKGLRYMGFYVLDKPFFLIRDPEVIKHVLVKDFHVFSDRHISPDVSDRLGYTNVFSMKNPGWKIIRSKLSPLFTSGRLKKLFESMLQVADDLDQFLENSNLGAGKIIEMKDLCANVTTDMIASTSFGLRVNSLNDPKAPFREQGREMFKSTVFRGMEFLIIFFLPAFTKITGAKFFGKETSKFLRTVFWDVIDERIKSGEKRHDLIDLLIELRQKYEAEGDLGGFQFSGDDLVSQAAGFFTAGFETSSTTMSFTLYEVAVNMDIQKTLRKEILEALQENDGKITYDMVMTLPYLDMVVSETMRKYPPLAFLDRVAGADYKVPNSDLVLKKGTPVYISMLGLHTDPEYFPDPEKYDPTRFNEENKQKRTPFTYFPFGDGPRICIGMRLGLMQSKLGLVQLLSKYEVLPCEDTPIPLVLDTKGFTTTSLGGLPLRVRKLTAKETG
ncbi:cytochrome P450 6k1 [Megalopta genalis]|uniref:cytochrome P450 6k1 n=1 Tax=Megalopta genalis TaxID=115081 RepID=UPI003FD3DBC5